MTTIPNLETSTQAQNLHQESIVVDLHVDPIIQQTLFGYHLSDSHSANWKPEKKSWLYNLVKCVTKLQKLHCPCFNHFDIPRMLKGGYTFGAFGIHSPPFRSERCWQTIQKQLDYFHELINEDDRIFLATEPVDIRRAFEQASLPDFLPLKASIAWAHRGKKTSTNGLTRIAELFNKFGVRCITLDPLYPNWRSDILPLI